MTGVDDSDDDFVNPDQIVPNEANTAEQPTGRKQHRLRFAERVLGAVCANGSNLAVGVRGDGAPRERER